MKWLLEKRLSNLQSWGITFISAISAVNHAFRSIEGGLAFSAVLLLWMFFCMCVEKWYEQEHK